VLPQETRNYVPIILAVTIMAKNPSQYGLEHVTPDPPVPMDQVTINYPVDLRLVSECVDTSVNSLLELNPSLLRLTTPKDQNFILNLPAASAGKYQTAITAIPLDMRTSWRYHRVEYGDTLASIAHKYHTSSSAIAQANSLPGEDVSVGAKLIIPIAPGRQGSETRTFSRYPTHYKVRKGDTLYSVADAFEVPVEKLRKWNHLRGTALVPGRTILVYKPLADADNPEVAKSSKSGQSGKREKPASAVSASSKHHKVRQGETLSSIAETYNTTVDALRRDNPKMAANLRAGDILVIRK
jgi:membrane-bound lytic murein transglycosylase D